MRTEQITFPGSTGARLAGVLHHPGGERRGSVLLAHCFTCSKDLHTMTRLSRGLTEAGYVVLRFDFTGIGDSGGDFADKTVTRNVQDLVQAATFLLQRGLGPCGMLVHSLGGTTALLAAARLRTVESVAVVGAPASPAHVRGLLAGSEREIEQSGQALVEIGGRRFPISAQFLEDLDRHDQRRHVSELGRPLLIVHAVADEVVPIGEGEANFAAARQPKACGETLTVTRAGVPVAELRPLASPPVTASTLLARWRQVPDVDPAALREDLDQLLEPPL